MQFAGFVCDLSVIFGSCLVWKAIYLKNYYKYCPEGSTAIITDGKGNRRTTTEKDVYGKPPHERVKIVRTSDDFEVKTRQSTKDRQVINLTLNGQVTCPDVIKTFDLIGPGIPEATKVILNRDISAICMEMNSKLIEKTELKSQLKQQLQKYSINAMKRFGLHVKLDVIEAFYDEPLKYRSLPQLIL